MVFDGGLLDPGDCWAKGKVGESMKGGNESALDKQGHTVSYSLCSDHKYARVASFRRAISRNFLMSVICLG